MRAEGIVVERRGRRLLDGVGFEVRPGRLTALLGPNGAGKSTLLRVLSGELRPDAGTVTLDGRPLAGWDPRRLARRRAVLSQSVALSFPLSVRDVVAIGRSPHAAGRAADEAAIARTLAAARVAHLAGRSYPTLSGGEQQRVQLARVLAQLDHGGDGGPEGGAGGGEGGGEGVRHLLLDEPTASLDLRHQAEVLALARSFADGGGAVLAVLHDPNQAAAFADEVVLLRGGRVVASGDPWRVLTAENLMAVFGHPVEVMSRRDMDRPLIVPLVAPAGTAPGLSGDGVEGRSG